MVSGVRTDETFTLESGVRRVWLKCGAGCSVRSVVRPVGRSEGRGGRQLSTVSQSEYRI